MKSTELPSLRTRRSKSPAECSHCGGSEFETQHGAGAIFWWGGVGAAMRFADSADGPRLDAPVRCTRCGTEHAPVIELPALERGVEQERARPA